MVLDYIFLHLYFQKVLEIFLLIKLLNFPNAFTAQMFCTRCSMNSMNINITNFTCAAVFHFASLFIMDEFIEMKHTNSLNHTKKKKVKFVLFAVLKKTLIILQ